MSTSLSPGSPYSGARPLPRPSSRSSFTGRTSPVLDLEDTVAVRNQMSTLKHTIRQQQAQLHNLENVILRGPRPLPPGAMGSPPHSPEEGEPNSSQSHTPNSSISKLKKRSSFEVLSGLAGPDSSLPLPRRDEGLKDSGIKEGVPMDFGSRDTSPNGYKRSWSPTRTLSRIPVASVGNARALAEEGQGRSLLEHSSSGNPPSSLLQPPSPNGQASGGSGSSASSSNAPSGSNSSRRLSFTPAGTTKVLADLQTGVINARNALENTRAQLRLSQRSVAQLTRQTEDLKEARERLRLENEGLNNVVARKERLLQEVLERARKAETEAAALKAQLKTEQANSKKTLRDMETELTESKALSQRSEREYITLRESIKGLVEGWKADTDGLKEEMRVREEMWKKEEEELGRKYRLLVERVEAEWKTRSSIEELRKEDHRIAKEVEDFLKEEIANLKSEIELSSTESDEAVVLAKQTADELARLRRLIQSRGRLALEMEDGVVPT